MAQNDQNDQIVTALITEYTTMRSEICIQKTAAHGNLNLILAFIALIISANVFFDKEKLLYVIPSAVFIGGMLLLTQTASINLLELYCLKIAKKIKARLGEDVQFDWGCGDIWEIGGHPLGLVACGYILIAVLALAIYIYTSILVYMLEHATLWLHLVEVISFFVYAIIASRYNTFKKRDEIINGKQSNPKNNKSR